ncbi:MAG: hypothetical protein KDJ31_06330 [Candidatus Competibacteraceae bacterium]|nr:hypothetical protein [Candidatus Competibacteraceae bacterium]MCB1820151.1 hypothetical protein [Candidatus Competibacteraceae bacterium]MCP5451300.1 hypothetical protein [Gammaproteobacteria bacterium]
MSRAVAWGLLWWLCQAAWAADPTVLILYPEAPPPYQQVFEQIMIGVAQTVERSPETLALPPTPDRANIRHWLTARRGAALLLLGQRALQIYQADWTEGPVLVGALNALPGQVPWPGVSLVIDPDLYLQTLHEVLPGIERVIAVYHARDDQWMSWVQPAATQRGLRVDPIKVTDTESAVRELTHVFKTLDPQTTALWFAKSTLDLNTELLYPFVLEEAWRRKIAVFSDTVAHAKRGFLFALYPDYKGVGVELGQRLHPDVAPMAKGWAFTRAARLALNHRTARHLGITLRDDVIQRASLLFPQP